MMVKKYLLHGSSSQLLLLGTAITVVRLDRETHRRDIIDARRRDESHIQVQLCSPGCVDAEGGQVRAGIAWSNIVRQTRLA